MGPRPLWTAGPPAGQRTGEGGRQARPDQRPPPSPDVRSITCAAARTMRRSLRESWPDGWCRSIYLDQTPPAPVRLDSCEAEVDIHQQRAGHWSTSTQYLHRIARRPTAACPGCTDTDCLASCAERTRTPCSMFCCAARLHALDSGQYLRKPQRQATGRRGGGFGRRPSLPESDDYAPLTGPRGKQQQLKQTP